MASSRFDRATSSAGSAVRVLLAAIVAALTIVGCSTPATEVLVFVDTDARTRVVSMRVSTSRGSVPSSHPSVQNWTRSSTPGGFSLPASFGVTPADSPRDGVVTLQVDVTFTPLAAGQSQVTIRRTTRFRFTPRVQGVIRLFFPVSCASEVPPPATCSDHAMPCTVSHYCELQTPVSTCGDDGRCVPIDVIPTPLTPDGGTDVAIVDRADAGAVDATDAGIVDSCIPQCTGRVCGPDSCGGSCGACATGSSCDPAGACIVCGSACSLPNPCTVGAIDCSTSPPVCHAAGNVTAGVACPGGVCNGLGLCVPCAAGTDCSGECYSATISCASGGPVCSIGSFAPSGAGCSSGACDGSGSCVCSPVTCAFYGLCDASAANGTTHVLQNDACGGAISCGDCCNTGTFCGVANQLTEFACACGNPPAGAGWVDVGGDCWHRFVEPITSC